MDHLLKTFGQFNSSKRSHLSFGDRLSDDFCNKCGRTFALLPLEQNKRTKRHFINRKKAHFNVTLGMVGIEPLGQRSASWACIFEHAADFSLLAHYSKLDSLPQAPSLRRKKYHFMPRTTERQSVKLEEREIKTTSCNGLPTGNKRSVKQKGELIVTMSLHATNYRQAICDWKVQDKKYQSMLRIIDRRSVNLRNRVGGREAASLTVVWQFA